MATLPNQMRMGEGLRLHFSWNPLNYLRPAQRLDLSPSVLMSEVDITDVSFYQKVIDYGKMLMAGAKGTIVRAGQNVWRDPYWEANWAGFRQVGLPRGSYFFYDSRVSPNSQADLYWSLIKSDPGELMAVADFEENYGGQYSGWRNLYNFQERLLGNGLPKEKLWIYTGYYYWLDHSPQSDAAALAYFAQYPLWLAWYTTNPAYVKIPNPWTNATTRLWQYGTPALGERYGVQTVEIDMNKWTGDLNSYLTYFNLGIPTPPTGGNVIHQGTVTTAGLNIRSTPDSSRTDNLIGRLVLNDQVEASEVVSGWWKLSKKNGLPQTGYAYEGATQQYIRTDAILDPPAVQLVPFDLNVTGFKPFHGELEVEPGV